MKKVLSLLLLLMTISSTVQAKGDDMPKYDIMGAGSATEGMALVKVYIYAKKVTDEDFKRAAVHGVVFRGFTGNNSGVGQPAMASPDAEVTNAEYCKTFFSPDGECQSYASIIPGSYERAKVEKGYRYGAIVQVNKKSLRKTLEKAGVVRSLSSGF